jgi:glycosyltransferase involved in cell wall biosynthesis
MICFIPTKGRLKTKTYKLFEQVGIEVKHFIEPQEIELYNVPNKVNIQKNNGGISYVRNFMLNYAKENKHDWIIMCDDDVTDFGEAINNKCITTSANVWNSIYDKAKSLPFEIYGLNYRQHAWHETKNYSINKSFVEVCVLLNVKNIKWSYRGEFNLKEDRDFVLQTIKYGNGVVKFNKLFYNAPALGKEGGLYNEYKLKKDEDSAKKMCQEWHPFITLKRKGKRIDIKTDIKALAIHFKKQIK